MKRKEKERSDVHERTRRSLGSLSLEWQVSVFVSLSTPPPSSKKKKRMDFHASIPMKDVQHPIPTVLWKRTIRSILPCGWMSIQTKESSLPMDLRFTSCMAWSRRDALAWLCLSISGMRETETERVRETEGETQTGRGTVRERDGEGGGLRH